MAGTVSTLLRLGLFGALVVVGLPARADTVVLQNGVVHSGAVQVESVEEVTILSDGIQWVFKKRDVKEIKYDKASAARELAAQKKRAAESHARAVRELEDRRTPPAKTSAPVTGKTVVAANQRADSSGQVIVYGTSWCGYCRKARAYFRSRDVAFIDKDIEADPAANQEMQRKCAEKNIRVGGVPVIDVYGTMIPGFDTASIDAALANHR